MAMQAIVQRTLSKSGQRNAPQLSPLPFQDSPVLSSIDNVMHYFRAVRLRKKMADIDEHMRARRSVVPFFLYEEGPAARRRCCDITEFRTKPKT